MANKEKDINNLKAAIYNEWAYDPPCWSSLYSLAWGTAYEDLLWPIDEIEDHLSYILEGEEAVDLADYCAQKEATAEFIDKFNWDNGGLGGICELLVEGPEIVEKVTAFMKKHCGYFFEEFGPEELEKEDGNENDLAWIYLKAAKAAKEDPEDYDKVAAMLKAASELLE